MAKLDLTSSTAITLSNTPAGRTWLRRYAGLSSSDTSATIVLVDGCSAPRVIGERGGHFTRGGARILHPSAYSRRGWSNMIYQTSSLRVQVGRDWTPLAYASAA